MSDVFISTYQIIGAGCAMADAHWAEYERVQKTHFEFMEARGAAAYRQGHSGRVYSLFFDTDHDPLPGYRGTGNKKFQNEKWLEEKVPRGNSKIGRDLQKSFDATEKLPSYMDLASQFGWTLPRIYPGSGSKVYFPTLCYVSLPNKVTFLRLPRKANDGWQCPKDLLTAIPEDKLMLYFHEHNLLAKEGEQ